MYMRSKCAFWGKQLLSVQSHLQCIESTVKRKDICSALCFTNMYLYDKRTHISILFRVYSHSVRLSMVTLYYKTSHRCKTRQGSLCAAKEHGEKKGVSWAWSWACMCFSFLRKWAMWLDIPGSVPSHTKDLGNMRTAKISQRYCTVEAEPRG